MKLNEFYVFTANPCVKYQLTEINDFYVWIKNIVTGTPYEINKVDFQTNYSLANG